MTSNLSPSLTATQCLGYNRKGPHVHCGSIKVFSRSSHTLSDLQTAYTVGPTTIIDPSVCSRFAKEQNTRYSSPFQSRHRIFKHAMDIKRAVCYKSNILVKCKANTISVYSKQNQDFILLLT